MGTNPSLTGMGVTSGSTGLSSYVLLLLMLWPAPAQGVPTPLPNAPAGRKGHPEVTAPPRAWVPQANPAGSDHGLGACCWWCHTDGELLHLPSAEAVMCHTGFWQTEASPCSVMGFYFSFIQSFQPTHSLSQNCLCHSLVTIWSSWQMPSSLAWSAEVCKTSLGQMPPLLGFPSICAL